MLDRTAKIVRRTARFGAKKVRFAGGHLRGLAALLRRLRPGRSVPVDDETVTQRIRSSALRDVGVSTSDVAVEVEDGVATLRGAVESRSLADELVERVRKVPGVRDVASTIRVSAASPAD